MREFIAALTLVLKALVPWLKEKTRHARMERIKQGYLTRVEQAYDDPARAFASFDDDLLSEGIRPAAHGDRSILGDKKDRQPDLPSDKRMVGKSDAG